MAPAQMNQSAFAVLVGTMFISMMGFGLLSPLLPIYAVELGADGIEIGLIASSFGILNCLFLPFIGRLSDRLGRKIFLCVGLFFLTWVALGFVWAKTPFDLILLRGLQGIATTMHFPVAQAYLGDLTPEGEEGRWMGYFNAVLFSGMGAGPLFGGVLNDLFGMPAVFVSTSVLTGISFAATLIILKEPAKKSPAEQPPLSLAVIIKHHLLRTLLLLRLTTGIGTASVITFLPILASEKLLLGTGLIGLILSSRTPVSVLQSYTGRLSDRYDRKTFIIGGTLVSSLFMALIPFSQNFMMLLVLNIAVSLGVTFSMPAATAYIVEAGRVYGMAATMSAFMFTMSLGYGIGPLLLGGLVDLWGLNYVFYAGALISLAGLLYFISNIRRY
jgi:DHA1 family multidrug resistance protein-like MFS transporter